MLLHMYMDKSNVADSRTTVLFLPRDVSSNVRGRWLILPGLSELRSQVSLHRSSPALPIISCLRSIIRCRSCSLSRQGFPNAHIPAPRCTVRRDQPNPMSPQQCSGRSVPPDIIDLDQQGGWLVLLPGPWWILIGLGVTRVGLRRFK